MSPFRTRCSGPGFRHPARPSPRWRAAPRYRRPSSKSRSPPPARPAPRPPPLAPGRAAAHTRRPAPATPAFSGPDSELAPYIVWVHGGPTSQVVPRLDLEKAFFTSRGIGIIDVNYGGSSGYGPPHPARVPGPGGVLGWAALAAVTSGIGGDGRGGDIRGVFAAATSYFGVADLRQFAAQTHDFESR